MNTQKFLFNCRNYVQIDETTAKLIWRPIINFENLLDFKPTKAYGNAVQYNLWLVGNRNDYNMQYGEEFQLTFPCRFHLAKFPFDSHKCSIYFGDIRYTTDELMIETVTLTDWSKDNGPSTSVGGDPLILDDLALPFGFELEVLPNKEKDINYNVSMAGILIQIERESFGMLLSGYCYPTVSFALLSMVSFLIHPDMVRQAKYFSLPLSKHDIVMLRHGCLYREVHG